MSGTKRAGLEIEDLEDEPYYIRRRMRITPSQSSYEGPFQEYDDALLVLDNDGFTPQLRNDGGCTYHRNVGGVYEDAVIQEGWYLKRWA